MVDGQSRYDVHYSVRLKERAHLQEGALAIYNLCIAYNIKLEVDWIHRNKNEYADMIRRIIDCDDWGLHPALFNTLDSN